jgi:hypothetical protein
MEKDNQDIYILNIIRHILDIKNIRASIKY